MEESRTKREIKSFWWTPEHWKRRWFGTLTLEPGHSPRLELIGEGHALGEDSQCPPTVIHGIDEYDRPVTLLSVDEVGRTRSGKVVRQTFIAGCAFVGTELSKVQDFKAHSLRFSIQYLYGWLGRSGREDTTAENSDAFCVRYQRPKDQDFPIDADLSLVVHTICHCKESYQEFHMREDAALTFRSKAGLSLNQCHELVRAVCMLLHLASLKPVYPVWMTAYQMEDKQKPGDQPVHRGVEIHSAFLREPQTELPLTDRWVFRFDNLRADFAEYIRRWLAWFREAEGYAEALGCYACTVYHPLPPELTLLHLTQACEAFYRAASRCSQPESSKPKKCVSSQSHKRVHLKESIKQVAEWALQSTTGPLSERVGNPETFAENVRITRNYYTHHNPEDRRAAAKGEALIRMNENLKLIFLVCVLRDLHIRAVNFGPLWRELAYKITLYTPADPPAEYGPSFE